MDDYGAMAREWLGTKPHFAGHGWTSYSDCERCVERLAALLRRVADEARVRVGSEARCIQAIVERIVLAGEP